MRLEKAREGGVVLVVQHTGHDAHAEVERGENGDPENAAAEVLTTLAPIEVLDATQEIERLLGRTRKSEDGIYHDRTIDIDLIAFNDIVMQTERLTLPHPLMEKRRFVLQPLYDIAPNWVHPLLHKSVRKLLKECADTSEILLM